MEFLAGIMKSEPGTYVLILRNELTATVEVGRWGQLEIVPGYFTYVGSALGPGGLLARVSRHCRPGKKMHWHIDYLRKHAAPVAVWYSHAADRLEHRWAACVAEMPGMIAVKGFGASDCRCDSHLFFAAAKPSFARFCEMAGGDVCSCTCKAVRDSFP